MAFYPRSASGNRGWTDSHGLMVCFVFGCVFLAFSDFISAYGFRGYRLVVHGVVFFLRSELDVCVCFLPSLAPLMGFGNATGQFDEISDLHSLLKHWLPLDTSRVGLGTVRFLEVLFLC